MHRGLLHGRGLGGGTRAFTLVSAFGSWLHLGWRLRLDVHLCLCLCSHSGGICGRVGGCRGYGVHGCGCNVGGGLAGMGNQRAMVMKKEGWVTCDIAHVGD
jgi:hypothetical protein